MITNTNIYKGRNWVVWQQKHQPMSCLTGKNSGWNRSLGTYYEAVQFCLNASTDQYKLGYCFTLETPFVGLDLDACRNPDTGDIAVWAMRIWNTLKDSIVLSNVSVSGTGVKLILRCDQSLKRGVDFVDETGFGDHKPQVELFCSSKYFALTDFDQDDINHDASPVNTNLLSAVMGYDVTDIAPEIKTTTSGDTLPSELADLLSRLDVMEFQDRDRWIKVMQASHHSTGGSDAGKEVFKKWSAGDEGSYSESDTERDWNSLNLDAARPVTLGTIISMIPPERRKRIEPEQEFEAVEQVSTRVLPWLLNEMLRTHEKLVRQFVMEVKTLRYVAEWKQWIAYVDGKWIVDAGESIKHGIVMDYISDMADRVPNTDGEEAAKASMWASRLGNWNNTNALLKQLRGARELNISSEQLLDNQYLLNFTNGTYDLKADEFREHRLDDYCMQQCDTDYVDGAEATNWIRAVGEIFGGDQELVSYVRRLLGKSIAGDNSSPTFNVFFGDGCNGKSTIVQTVGNLLGEYSCSLPSEMLDSRKELHPTYFAKLFGKRLAMFAEMEANTPLAEGIVKKITSSDAIEARRMYENLWSFDPTHTAIICTNHKPKIKGQDTGIWRRMRLIPFEVDLTKRVDKTLQGKLDREKAGISNWLIEGFREYRKQGEGVCQAVTDATSDYRNDQDVFAEVAGELFEKVQGEFVKTSDAHSHYARSGGRYGRKTFVTEMKRIGYEAGRVQKNGSRVMAFLDMRIVNELSEFGA
tara:strand:+ start:2724 stop:4979 length:2256 start_codon:yes stop_codon:yes gene_type:complete